MPLTKNQKIALGIGGGGCLLIIIALIVCAAALLVYQRQRPASNYNRIDNFNSNYNRNTNSNSSNTNSTDNSPPATNKDGQHRLYQAAAASYDRELIKRVNRKLGLLNSDDVPNKQYEDFIKEHFAWLFRDAEWLKTINTQDKARAYVEKHIDD